MAGLKKNKRQKDNGSPNLVLVLFLILFVVSNIILRLLLYFTYQEKDKALAPWATKDKELKGERNAVKLYQTVADEMRMALGEKLPEADKATLDQNRAELFKDDGGAFKGVEDKNREAYKKLILEMLRKDLEFDAASG